MTLRKIVLFFEHFGEIKAWIITKFTAMKFYKAISTLFFVAHIVTAAGQGTWKKITEELIVKDPPFKQCHASTLVAVSSKKILAAWFGGSREGGKDVCIWLSENKNGVWAKPFIVATGIVNDSLRYPAWNPVLFKTNKGKLMLFYKVGPSPQTWWGMMQVSGDEGKTWSVPSCLPDGILGPIKNKPYQLKNGTILSGSSEESKTKWWVHLEKSTDDGISWKRINIDTTGFDVIQPSIIDYGHGKLQILCRSRQGAVVQAWSEDDGETWGRLSKTALLNPNSGTDAVTLSNGKQLIVYNPDVPGKDWFNGRAKLHVAVSEDGNTWKDIAILENGSTEEFSYPAVIQTKDGKVHITYTFDRKNIKHVVLIEK